MTTLLAVLALICLAPAVAAVLVRNLIHSALLFVLAWLGLAAFYLALGAEFVAFAQALVYVGGVSMVALFAVLLTRPGRTDLLPPPSAARAVGGLAAVSLVASMLASSLFWSRLPSMEPTAPIPLRRLGELLAGPYLVAVLLVGLILTVALIGGLLLAAPRRPAEGADA
ncbi:MAG: NADH-quinone oxidoreductase subunit J [Verrucomicrobia bacterium]|nr:NADH-quinone oxidoreductase subunit J [Verrucomicrobiota bacterium]